MEMTSRKGVMEYGIVPGVDKAVSHLVFGTGSMLSTNLFVFPSNKLKRTWFSILDAVFDMGCTAYDTAHVYQFGDAERTLGAWIRQRGVREKVVIINKG